MFAAGNTFEPQAMFAVVEAFAFHIDPAERWPELIYAENFEALARTHIVEPLHAANRMPILSCMLPEMFLARLPYWKPFKTLEEYLNSKDVACMAVFRNSVYLHNDIPCYPVEFRVYPIITVYS